MQLNQLMELNLNKVELNLNKVELNLNKVELNLNKVEPPMELNQQVNNN